MKRVIKELLQDVRIEDLSEESQSIAEIVGMEKFIELCYLACGEALYFPIPEKVILKARNRKIKAEFNGRNYVELSKKYGVTARHIRDIIKKGELIAEQLEFEW